MTSIVNDPALEVIRIVKSQAFATTGILNSHSCCSKSNFLLPLVEFPEGQLALQAMALLAVTNLFLQRRQEVESDICGLKVFWISVRHVVCQRSKG